ncbi:hypothetical protein Pelo_3120 [Pelomyxa schiedti]|nr:hypothetical protein Pelo_3120 [Pelomyxa schiedti]
MFVKWGDGCDKTFRWFLAVGCGIAGGDLAVSLLVALRYRGQFYKLRVKPITCCKKLVKRIFSICVGVWLLASTIYTIVVFAVVCYGDKTDVCDGTGEKPNILRMLRADCVFKFLYDTMFFVSMFVQGCCFSVEPKLTNNPDIEMDLAPTTKPGPKRNELNFGNLYDGNEPDEESGAAAAPKGKAKGKQTGTPSSNDVDFSKPAGWRAQAEAARDAQAAPPSAKSTTKTAPGEVDFGRPPDLRTSEPSGDDNSTATTTTTTKQDKSSQKGGKDKSQPEKSKPATNNKSKPEKAPPPPAKSKQTKPTTTTTTTTTAPPAAEIDFSSVTRTEYEGGL